jgi:hypothetical protein
LRRILTSSVGALLNARLRSGHGPNNTVFKKGERNPFGCEKKKG